MMNILPGIGISKIRIGMSQTELIETYGKPDKIVHVKSSNEIRFIYNELMVTACFSFDDKDKLYYIECANKEVCLWKQHIIGIHKDVLVQLLKEKEAMKIEYLNYNLYEVVYCENIGMEFIIEFDIVQKISVSMLFDSTGNEKLSS